VAASYPHKNLQRLVQAFPPAVRDGHPVQLVLVGLKGVAEPVVGSANVKRLSWVDDVLLGTLYRRSRALAFPSLYEGFGLPILEAMAQGTPVLTSNFGAMAEIADGAAELVDPYDVAAIKAGLERLVFDDARRAELRALGLRRAAEFSWDRTALETKAVYEAMMSSS